MIESYVKTDDAGVALWPVARLRPSEAVCDASLAALTQSILAAGVWTHPIPVCERSGLVMDGNHRLRAADFLGLVHVPVIPLNYRSGRVSVRDRRHGGAFDLSELDLVIRTGALLPYKTTAHEFDPPLPETAIEISRLRRDAL